MHLNLQTSTGVWVDDSLVLPGGNFSWGEGVVHGNVPCKELDISSAQDWPLFLSPVKVAWTFEKSAI